MKILASSKPDMLAIIEEEFKDKKPGLVVLPEYCFTKCDITPYKEISGSHPITILGTKDTEEGYNLTYLIQSGNFWPVHIFINELQFTKMMSDPNLSAMKTKNLPSLISLAKRLDIVYSIPGMTKPFKVIIRECTDIIYLPSPPGNEKVDFLITSCNVDQTQNMNLIKKVHRNHIGPNTLLVQAMDKSPNNTGVYDLTNGNQLGTKKEGYTLYDLVR